VSNNTSFTKIHGLWGSILNFVENGKVGRTPETKREGGLTTNG